MLDRRDQERVKRDIVEILHGKIVPNLLQKMRKRSPISAQSMNYVANFEFHDSDVTALSRHLMNGDSENAGLLVQSHIDNGCPVSTVILDLLTKTSRYLGDRWCSDNISFADVTLGVSGIHTLLRDIEKGLTVELLPVPVQGLAVFAAVPGDTHILGVSVLESYFRSAGWSSEAFLDASGQELVELVSRQNIDLFGLSISCRQDLSKAKNLITKIRSKSMNADLKIMVGGNAVGPDKLLAQELGADNVADNANDALEIAASICELDNIEKLIVLQRRAGQNRIHSDMSGV